MAVEDRSPWVGMIVSLVSAPLAFGGGFYVLTNPLHEEAGRDAADRATDVVWNLAGGLLIAAGVVAVAVLSLIVREVMRRRSSRPRTDGGQQAGLVDRSGTVDGA